MADSREEAKNQKDITNEKREQQRLDREAVDQASQRQDFARQLTEELKDQMGMRKAMSEEDKKILGLSRQIQNTASQITRDIGNEEAVRKQIAKDVALQRNIQQEINIATKRGGQEAVQVASIISNSLIKRQKLEEEIADLQAKAYAATEEDAAVYKQQIRARQKSLDGEDAKLAQIRKNTGQVAFEEGSRLAVLQTQQSVIGATIQDKQNELKIQESITKTTGVTGALVEGVGGIMQRLGMRSGIFANAMAEAQEHMREAVREGKELGKELTKAQAAAKAFEKLAPAFRQAMFDPLTLSLALVDAFFKLDAAGTKAQQVTGQFSDNIAGANGRLITSVQYMEQLVQLSAETGRNANNIFTSETIAAAAEFQNLLGLSATETSKLAVNSTAIGQSFDAQAETIVDTVAGFNSVNKSAVSANLILRDVAHASDGIKASFAGMPGAIAEAASMARKLGMELSDLDSVAKSLLDFESSIESELEAQLLTGKQLNLGKARELALNNDLTGVGKEIFKNSASIAEFGKMNRIQQEAQAKALGLTRDQLAKIAYQRALDNNMTKEAAAAAAGVSLEDMKRMEVQEQMNVALQKLAQAFAPILNIVGDIASGLSSIIAPIAGFVGMISGTFLGKLALIGIILAKSFGGAMPLLTGFSTKLGGLTKMFDPKNIKSYFGAMQGGLKGMGKRLTDAFKMGTGDFVKSKAGDLYKKDSPQGKMIENMKKGAGGAADKAGELGDKATDAANKSTTVPQEAGKGVKDFLTNLATGLKEMASGKVVGGAFALIPAAIGLTTMLAAIPTLLGLQLIKGDKVEQALVGVANGLVAFGEAVKAGAKYFLIGLAALAGIGAAMIPLTYALSKLAPLISAVGDVFKSAFEGIGNAIKAATEGIATMLGVITLDKVAALALLGPALISAAAGLTYFSIASLLSGGGISTLSELAALASPLSTVGTSITQIAAGLAAMSAALATLETEKLDSLQDLITTTALAAPAIAATGAITSLIQGITGTGGEGGNTDAKLDELIAAVKSGANVRVYLDSDDITKRTVIESTTLS